MLQEFSFGVEALSYLQSSLSEGGTLAQYLLALPLSDGYIWSRLPVTVSTAKRMRFTEGGVDPSGESELWLATFIGRYLQGRQNAYAVFETLWRPHDPGLARQRDHFFTHGPEVYSFLTSRDRDLQDISWTVRGARDYPFIGALTTLPENAADLEPHAEVTTDVLREVALRTEHILVGAYDAEAELVWSRVRAGEHVV